MPDGDPTAITFVTLQQAVLGKRFPQTELSNAKRWINTAYADVWDAFPWPFKIAQLEDLTVTAGSREPTLVSAATFGDALTILDNFGCELERLDQPEFDARYGPDLILGNSGRPEAYMVGSGSSVLSTWPDRQILLGPVPSASATFKMSYHRRRAYRNAAGALLAGDMTADTDRPLWRDHNSILIPRAQAIGLQELNDPTWQTAQAEYERQLDRMKENYDLIPSVRQWGRYA